MNRFVLLKSEKKENAWICVDTENELVCEFDDKKYYETRLFIALTDSKAPDYFKFSEAEVEINKWLCKNHKEKLFAKISSTTVYWQWNTIRYYREFLESKNILQKK